MLVPHAVLVLSHEALSVAGIGERRRRIDARRRRGQIDGDGGKRLHAAALAVARAIRQNVKTCNSAAMRG
jgi:hypothetical protein